MTRSDLRAQWILLAAALLLLASAVAVNTRLSAERGEEPETDLLFLPSGRYLQTVSFGYDNVLADWIYLWAIQYYTDFSRGTRFAYLQRTFEVITDLDPQYIDAYMIGALIIVAEGKEMRRAIDLLDKGIAANPQDYLLPLDAGYYFRDTFKQPERAAHYFNLAAGRPGAPNYIKRLAAGMTERAGDKRTSYELWKRAFDEAEKEEDRLIAELHLRTLHDEINLEALRSLVAEYQRRFGRFPSRLEQLERAGLIERAPRNFRGEEYCYDPLTGRVSAGDLAVIKER